MIAYVLGISLALVVGFVLGTKGAYAVLEQHRRKARRRERRFWLTVVNESRIEIFKRITSTTDPVQLAQLLSSEGTLGNLASAIKRHQCNEKEPASMPAAGGPAS